MGATSKMAAGPFLPSNMAGLTPDMVEKARVELGETPEVRRNALRELKQKIKDEPSLSALTDERFLLRFLRVKKFKADTAFDTLRNYYAFRQKHARKLTMLRPSELQHVLDMRCICELPLRHPSGASVGYMRLGRFDEKAASVQELVATALMCSDVNLDCEATVVCGSLMLLDLRGLTARKLLHFSSPTLLANITLATQDCLPSRLKGLHIVNENSYFHAIFSVAKKFMHKKNKERIFFHGSDYASLHKHLPPEILPQELGGKLPPNFDEAYNASILAKEDYILHIGKYGYDVGRKQRRRSSILQALKKA